MLTVCEESIALAILRLLETEKTVVEGGGAVGLAALLSGKLPHLKGKRCANSVLNAHTNLKKYFRVVNILTGGNIDSTVLGRTIERGLAVDGRLVKFDVVVSDRPGGALLFFVYQFYGSILLKNILGIAELATLIAKTGGSIKDASSCLARQN